MTRDSLRPQSTVTWGGLAAWVSVAATLLGGYYAVDAAIDRAAAPLLLALDAEVAARREDAREMREALEAHRSRAEDAYARRGDVVRIESKVDGITRRVGWLVRKEQEQ